MTTSEPPIDARELRDMLDEQAIRRLHAHYVDAVNRSAWGEFVDLFIPAAELTVSRGGAQPDRVVGPAAISDLIAGYIAKYDFLIQVILNARIELRWRGDVDAASARLYIAEFRQWTNTGRRLESAGVYHDRYTRVDGQWRFSQRRYDRLYATAHRELEIYPFPSVDDVDDPFARG
ncbi:MAG: nuclear transport factor 2 family protein [Acidimicrobiales bacterium]